MSNQSLKQASVRAQTGTALTYEGDWHSLWDMPSSIPGLELWLDADDASTITVTGSGVSSWVDKVAGYDFVQAADASRPGNGGDINGRNALIFDGSDDSVAFPGDIYIPSAPEKYTMFFVLHPDAAAGGNDNWWFSGTGAALSLGFRFAWSSTSYQAFIGTSSPGTYSPATAERVVQRLTVTIDDALNSSTITRNGQAATTISGAVGSPGVQSPVIVGEGNVSNNRYHGLIGEILFYSRELSDDERSNVEAYLDSKWGFGAGHAGYFNERMLAWLNSVMLTSYSDLPGAQTAFAQAHNVANWDSLGTIDFTLAMAWNGTVGFLPTGFTFTRASEARSLDGRGILQVAQTNEPRYGYLSEEARTQLMTRGVRDLSDSSWTKTGTAAALDAVGLDGIPNSASTLAATAVNGTCVHPIVATIADHSCSAYVRRKKGNGTVSFADDGVTWVDITSNLSAKWYRAAINRNIANPRPSFQLAEIGDEIEVDFVQVEEGLYPTTPILSGTRAADYLSANYSLAGPVTIIVDGITPPADSSETRVALRWDAAGSVNNLFRIFRGTGENWTAQVRTGGTYHLNASLGMTSPGEPFRIILASADADHAAQLKGGTIQTASLGTPPTPDLFKIGANVAGINEFNSTISNVIVLNRRVPDSEFPFWLG